MTTRREPELVALRKLAEDLASRRSERLTTGHLLAAIAARPCPAAELLQERRLGADVLLSAARVGTDDAKDAIERALQRAREVAGRANAREPGPEHLLLALCHDRQGAAHRALEQCGVDVGKLRTAAMAIAMGLAPPRRRVPETATANGSNAHPLPLALRKPASPYRPAIAPPERSPKAPVKAAPPSSHAPPATHTRPSAPATPRASAPPPSTTRPIVSKPAKTAPATPHRAVSKASNEQMKVPAPREREKGQRAASFFALDPKRFPLLSQIATNLTLAAANGELDPVVGRDAEVERTLDVLAKRKANNPCLVGGAGVGKTSVVRGLARMIAAGKDVASLDERIILEVETARLFAGTGMRGALAERLGIMKAEVARGGGRIVLFFDEIHTLFGADAGDEASAELKLALARGELPCIGATTTAEYRRVIEADPALARRFTPIEVDELDPEHALLALTELAPSLGKHHGASYADDALAAAVQWSVRYLPGSALPDKALNLLDLAGARAHRRGERAVSRRAVAEVLTDLAEVPLDRLMETDGDRLLRLHHLLGERVVGHETALARIATVLRRNASGLAARRPIGSFLLLGPTGVGKTETAKAIAECLFSSENAMTRLDLSEYAEPHAIARLIGAPPGYVGHESGGQLTEAVRRRPYQVILLDEIEKAHRDVLEAFLQVFDEGRMTDGRGRTIDFTSTVLVLTSNLGADVSMPKNARGKIGFGGKAGNAAAAIASGGAAGATEAANGQAYNAYEAAVLDRVKAELPPELYNRLDEVLAFAPLTRVDVAEVARRMLKEFGASLLASRGVTLDASEEAIDALLDAGGFDPELGARPMRRAIARLVEAPIAELFLRGLLGPGGVATVDAEDGKIVVDAVKHHAA